MGATVMVGLAQGGCGSANTAWNNAFVVRASESMGICILKCLSFFTRLSLFFLETSTYTHKKRQHLQELCLAHQAFPLFLCLFPYFLESVLLPL